MIDKEELKDFIRDNLVIEINYASPYGGGNDMEISLRLNGDDNCFSSGTVFIPEDNT